MLNRQALSRFFPFLKWPAPTGDLLRADLMAGITVGLVAVPQAVAYAALAGMPVVAGIYASFLPTLIAALFAGTPRVSVGPTALSCLLVYASLSGLAEPGSAQWVALAVWLALLSGVLQIVLGVARFGWVVQLVNAPVLMAFTQAATVLIIWSQLPALFGTTSLWPLGSVYWPAALYGVLALAALLVSKKVAPIFRMVLLWVVGGGVPSWATGFGGAGGAIIGALPSGLPGLYVPSMISMQELGVLMVPAMVIGLVSFMETASSAKTDNQKTRQPWNEDQDLIGQGMAKLASAFTGSFPTSSSFSRSALNLFAGARSGWSSVVTVLMVLVVLLWLTPALSYVPKAVLSAVVVAAVLGVMKPQSFVKVWRLSKVEGAIAGITFVVTLMTAPRIYWGVIAGVLLGLSHFLYQRLHPRIIEVGLHPDGSLRDRHLWNLPPLAPNLYALRMDSALNFASAASLERNVTEYLAQHQDVAHVCLFAQPINHMDATGAEVFGQMRRTLADAKVTLHISGIKLPVEKLLKTAGELPDSPWLKMYRTDAEALTALQHRSAADDIDWPVI